MLQCPVSTDCASNCASCCSGNPGSYDNNTTCGLLCHDIGNYRCEISGSTFRPGFVFGNAVTGTDPTLYNGTCHDRACASGFCCVHNDIQGINTALYYCLKGDCLTTTAPPTTTAGNFQFNF